MKALIWNYYTGVNTCSKHAYKGELVFCVSGNRRGAYKNEQIDIFFLILQKISLWQPFLAYSITNSFHVWLHKRLVRVLMTDLRKSTQQRSINNLKSILRRFLSLSPPRELQVRP